MSSLTELAAQLRQDGERLLKAADILDPKPTSKPTNGRKRRGRPPKKATEPALDSGNSPAQLDRPPLGLG